MNKSPKRTSIQILFIYLINIEEAFPHINSFHCGKLKGRVHQFQNHLDVNDIIYVTKCHRSSQNANR